MKFENDLLVVRMGEGYIIIDEFLEQYTGVKFQKLEKKDPQLRKLVSDNELIKRSRLQELLEKSRQTQNFSDRENINLPLTSLKQNQDDRPAESLLLKDLPKQL